MAAKSLISYTCLITVVRSHFLFHMQPSRVKQAGAGSEHGPDSHLIKTMQKRPPLYVYFLCSTIVILYKCVFLCVCLCVLFIMRRKCAQSPPQHPAHTLFQRLLLSLHSQTQHISGNITVYAQIKLFYIHLTL